MRLCGGDADVFRAEGHDLNGFDVYQVPDALDPEAPMDASVFLNGKLPAVVRGRTHGSCSQTTVRAPRSMPRRAKIGLRASTIRLVCREVPIYSTFTHHLWHLLDNSAAGIDPSPE